MKYDWKQIHGLALAAKTGDEGARTELLQIAYRFSRALIRQRNWFVTGSQSDENDMVQLAVIGVDRSLQTWDGGGDFATRFRVTVDRKLITAMIEERRVKRLLCSDAVRLDEPRYSDGSEDLYSRSRIGGLGSRDPADSIRSAADRDLIAWLLKDLPTPQLLAFMATRFDGYSGAEVAQMLGRTPKAVDNLAQKVRRKIRAKLERLGVDMDPGGLEELRKALDDGYRMQAG